jgi:hypothetical protein
MDKAKIWEFIKLPLQIAIGLFLVSMIDHFVTKPAINSLESLDENED